MARKVSRINDLRRLWKADRAGEDSAYYKGVNDDIGNFGEYGLSFEYVEGEGKRAGFWCYLISFGGPQEEFRFYADSPAAKPYKITFAFLDWSDGYERALKGRDLELMTEIWEFFQEIGSTEHAYNASMEG